MSSRQDTWLRFSAAGVQIRRIRRRLLTGSSMAIVGLCSCAVVWPAAAEAQTKGAIEARLTRDYQRCMRSGDAAGGVTSAILDCTGSENERQDAKLNQVYRSTLDRLSSVQRDALRASERAWIVKRKSRCDHAAAAEEGGSLATILYGDCMLDETIKRTMWLERYRP